VSLSPSYLTFGPQLVGTTSPAQALASPNSGSVPVNISGISASTDFGETNNCGTSLAAGATCTIKVTFAPALVAGVGEYRTGSLTVTDDSAGSPRTVGLTGYAWTVSLSPANLYFYSQPV